MNSSKKPKFNLTNVETRLLELMEEMKQLAREFIKMISIKALRNSLDNKLVFLPLSDSTAKKVSAKIDYLRDKFLTLEYIPHNLLKKYVRYVITLDIGVYLKESNLPKQVFTKNEFLNLHSAWYNPNEYFV